jgi:hypothetical protein
MGPVFCAEAINSERYIRQMLQVGQYISQYDVAIGHKAAGS